MNVIALLFHQELYEFRVYVTACNILAYVHHSVMMLIINVNHGKHLTLSSQKKPLKLHIRLKLTSVHELRDK